ncbi:39S ribosomal protein L45, mitochondrial isoform X2 [Hypomesus transpacificus]|uniref:39S ribosomal protein L45, mitochondrial isoform X2 n=1 Tax=Hypomesus transpacificus TaxID=137520 RepID=UPI001F087385|nr:39S ribosomal protein L45, mitochondrial isoform X2 [Hypomesus transpacificus]
MAMSTRSMLLPFHRMSCCNLKNAVVSLDMRFPLPFVVSVRTKKRYFIPPAVGIKGKTQVDQAAKARAAGIIIKQEYMERAINIACTAGVFDPYIPPEGDSRLSSLSKEGLKQRTEQIRQSAASQLAFNKEKLHSLVTERCYPEMTRANRYKTLRWNFVESLEPPKVVHARCPDMVSKGNLYGQVTIRIHSRQTLAIYDRFGRLMLGSEEEPKDVLEYLVLERHLINLYGRWRLHGKIVPAWAPAKDPIIKTVMIPGPELKPGEEFETLNFEVPKPKAIQWHK